MSASARSAARTTNSCKVPAINSAFKAQSRKEQDKLKGALAKHLRQDMKRLLDEGTFADVRLLVNSERIPAHCEILQARLAEFFTVVIQPRIVETEEDEKVVDLSGLGITALDLKNMLRAAYTEDNVMPDWDVVKGKMNPQDLVKSKTDTDQQHVDTEYSLPETNTVNSQVTNSAQEAASLKSQMEIPDANVGNQIGTTDASTMNICENIGLESVKTTVGCEPETMEKNAPDMQDRPLEQPDLETEKPSDRSQSFEGSGGRKSTVSSSAESQTKPTGMNPKVSAKSGNLSAETRLQSSLGESPLPVASCRLGRDLLGIFTDDSAPDVIIKVDGKEIPAHRFMLCARSQYFAAMLLGSWRESSSCEIELTSFTYAAVILALRFIYGGAYELPDGVILRDVLYMADMYALDMLKDVVVFKLRKDYCHFFHKPCSMCLEYIPECLLLISNIDLSNLTDDIFSWQVQFLDRTWSQKAFATLPQDLLVRCRDFAVRSLSRKSAVGLLLQIDKLVCNLPHVSWTKVIRSAALHLQDACIKFIAMNFMGIVEEDSFLSLLEGMNWKKDIVEPVFDCVISSLTRDLANFTFLALHSLQITLTDDFDKGKWNQDAVAMVHKLYSQCYNYMVSNVNLVVRAGGWNRLPEDLRERIKKEGMFVESHWKAPARRPVLSSSLKGKSQAWYRRNASDY
ncbi:uncharacterized protein LOC110983836 [Acanthaster planci]|uniref:Uncharacterized protein LOC110983836 n=1 Tax=Acanthaster planci TaxID=133434 RepID=A0A8B7Z0H8_ACAPL|nr:uncharacterized protein LOC110983836 [Acanthaster planci]XP_022099108.1 uncharacterized protein LOC110983836 [Acanthaster planci]XP_022099109.1 uncharacterized protein LOC110983836 [Acanthaster planci]